MKLRRFLSDAKTSWVKKYQGLFVGRGGLINLLKYELVTSLFGPLPGALGLYLRKAFFPIIIGKIGRNDIFGRNIVLRHPNNLIIADNVVIEDNCVLDAKGSNNSLIKLGSEVIIGRNTILRTRDGCIEIGSNTNIGSNCIIGSENMVKIGRNVLIAAFCYIVGGGEHGFDDLDVPIMYQDNTSKGGVCVGDNVWLGAGVKILDGVKIGKDCIIGAGSIVTRDIPDYSIAFGIPARVQKKRQ